MGKLNATILLRSDTSTNWLDANPILALGEAGYETDTHKLKIGNGTTNWKDLSYIASESDLVVQNKSIETVEKLPPEGDASFFYKVKSTSLIYFGIMINLLLLMKSKKFQTQNLKLII